jgi:hypothetical protein
VSGKKLFPGWPSNGHQVIDNCFGFDLQLEQVDRQSPIVFPST